VLTLLVRARPIVTAVFTAGEHDFLAVRDGTRARARVFNARVGEPAEHAARFPSRTQRAKSLIV
jgi:hypothetical protein